MAVKYTNSSSLQFKIISRALPTTPPNLQSFFPTRALLLSLAIENKFHGCVERMRWEPTVMELYVGMRNENCGHLARSEIVIAIIFLGNPEKLLPWGIRISQRTTTVIQKPTITSSAFNKGCQCSNCAQTLFASVTYSPSESVGLMPQRA